MALASCEQLVTFALLWFASLKAFGLQRTQAASRLCGLIRDSGTFPTSANSFTTCYYCTQQQGATEMHFAPLKLLRCLLIPHTHRLTVQQGGNALAQQRLYCCHCLLLQCASTTALVLLSIVTTIACPLCSKNCCLHLRLMAASTSALVHISAGKTVNRQSVVLMHRSSCQYGALTSSCIDTAHANMPYRCANCCQKCVHASLHNSTVSAVTSARCRCYELFNTLAQTRYTS
eukprot:6893-Heterococcus_DN1.PRE.2